MSDIFGRNSDAFGGSFAADAARVTFASDPGILGTSGGVGLMTQNLAFSYLQQVNRLFEVGTNFSFYIAGRTQGNMSLGRILGPRPVSLGFYTKYASVCNAATNHLDLQMSAGCAQVGSFNQNYAFSMKYCVLISIAVSVAAMDMMINEQLAVMFASLGMRGVSG